MIEQKSYTIHQSEWLPLIKAYLVEKGIQGDISSVNPAGDLLVKLQATTIGEAPAPVIPQPAPAPVTEVFSGALECIATCFGYQDPGDNGVGAWGASTNNQTLVGVAVPIPILEATMGGIEASHIKGWTVNCFVEENKRGASKLDIVDKGPGADVNGQHGLIVGSDGLHALDLTYGACTILGVRYDANNASYKVKWWFTDPQGADIAPKGLNAPRKQI